MNGEALYYGLNALSNNLIMADRKKLKNPNGLILGTLSDGELRETQMTNYFSNLYPIDCAVLSVNAQSYRKYGTLPEHEFLPEI